MPTDHPTWRKVNPPIRLPADRNALWSALQYGEIDILESDHAPHALEEKDVDFDDAPSGMPGVETMYPLLLAFVKQQRLELSRLLSLICERPADLAGLQKGRLEVGRDADLIIVDLKHTSRIAAEHLHSRCGWTAFEGFEAIFPIKVFLRGELIVDGSELIGSPGIGCNVMQREKEADE